jgi:glutamyl-tRNA synthetase
MKWLGMHSDEPMVIQSQRVEFHRTQAYGLMASGHAYKCFCTQEELDQMRETAMAEGRKPKYDGTWRDRTDHPTDGRPFTIRFKTPLDGQTTFHDLVLGDVSVNNEELDDLVLLRSDGAPTYNFVVVCDDGDMGITHVVRGQDHVSNTYRQVHLYHALGYALPEFAHLPMIEGLSKRKGSASVTTYRDMGYHPEAIINYLARLGWSHGDQELFDIDELIQLFDLSDVNKASGKFDDAKLEWVNEQWMKRLPPHELASRVLAYMPAEWGASADDRLMLLVSILRERAPTMVEFVNKARFAFEPPADFDEKSVARFLKAEFLPAFRELTEALAALPAFDVADIAAAFERVIESTGVAVGKLAQPVRVALTGGVVSPPIHETVAAVGQAATVQRMRAIYDLFHD